MVTEPAATPAPDVAPAPGTVPAPGAVARYLAERAAHAAATSAEQPSSLPEPDVTIIAVTYNSARLVAAFLRALPDALAGIDTAAVVVVDNASADGSPDLVRALAPWAHVIDAGGNLGYGAGINVGLRAVRARRGVFILNPDAVVAPGSVATLLAATAAHPKVGLAVPRILTHDGVLKFSLRREPTLGRALGEAVLGGHRAARFAALGEEIREPSYYADGAGSDWATGAALFVPRRALDAVGGMDERFFLYSEETDYALRIRDAGMRLRYVPAASVAHPGGDMSKSPFLWSLVATNRARLYRKRHGPLRSGIYWAVVLGGEAVRAALGRPTSRAAVRSLLAMPAVAVRSAGRAVVGAKDPASGLAASGNSREASRSRSA